MRFCVDFIKVLSKIGVENDNFDSFNTQYKLSNNCYHQVNDTESKINSFVHGVSYFQFSHFFFGAFNLQYDSSYGALSFLDILKCVDLRRHFKDNDNIANDCDDCALSVENALSLLEDYGYDYEVMTNKEIADTLEEIANITHSYVQIQNLNITLVENSNCFIMREIK